jgi:hypothetical protein
MGEAILSAAFYATPLFAPSTLLRRHPAALRSSVFALFVVPFIGAVIYWKGVRYFLYFLAMILSAVLAALDWRRRHLPDLPFLAGALPLRVAGIQTLHSERPARGRVMAAWGIPWIARGSRSSAR